MREVHTIGRLSLSIVLIGLSIACSGRERINASCQWTHDAEFPVDLADRTHQTHLRHDADLMEDLAIRYADAHAGRVARPEWAEARDACMTTLFAVIGDYHSVSEGDIRQWIGRRNVMFDLFVFLSFVGWCGLGSRAPTRRLLNAWSFQGALAVFATGVTIIIVATVGGVLGVLWAALFEMLRLGSEHMSHRAARVPWPYYLPSLFAAAGVVVSFVAWREHRAVARRVDAEDPSSITRVLLR